MEKKKELQQILDQLRSLREKIATLCIVKCRMAHERVVRDSATGLPVISRFPEGSHQRVGLCTPEIRATRLGCSHTSARIQLDDAINLLGRASGKPAFNSPSSSELAWLNNAIHLLDHRKGEAEKRLAGILDEAHRGGEPGNKDEKVREVENEICEMEQLHDDYVERIGQLRERVILEIDRLLGDQNQTSKQASVVAD